MKTLILLAWFSPGGGAYEVGRFDVADAVACNRLAAKSTVKPSVVFCVGQRVRK